MQRDFHYYAIGLLARAAGFNSEDALTIAYASQYTDDATESKPISLTDEAGDLQIKFDPARTSYFGLKAKDWSIQKRVNVPFHFLPPQPFIYTDPESYQHYPGFLTEAGSPFATMLLRKAAEEPNKKRRLCRLGIALHMFADTWAHQDFSGRSSEKENGIEDIQIWEQGEWKWDRFTDDFLELMLEIFAEEIGHAEAGYLPDLSFIRWRYTKKSGEKRERDNQSLFLAAAERIDSELRALEKPDGTAAIPWGEIRDPLAQLLAQRGSLGEEISLREKFEMYLSEDQLEERIGLWKAQFQGYFDPPESYHYDRKAWRDLALNPNLPDPTFDPQDRSWEQDLEALPLEAAPGERDLGAWDAWAQGFDYEKDYGFDVESTAWDEWSREEFERRAQFPLKPSFPDSLWAHFHRAALRHRALVVELLP